MAKSIIAIPSYGRANNQTSYCSFKWIPPKWRRQTRYYVEAEEAGQYLQAMKSSGVRLFTTQRAEVAKSWGAIMDLIIDECCQKCDHLVIMDDDLRLDVRPRLPDEPTYFEHMLPSTFDSMMKELQAITTMEVPLTSIQYRQFCQVKVKPYQHNQRISMLWSMNARFFREHPQHRFYRQSKLAFMGDYYFFMKLLQSGYPNVCINRYTKDDRPNAPGGEEEKRHDKDRFNRAVRQFAAMFPEYVTVREKVGKTHWQDGMLGVTILANRLYKNVAKKER